MPHHLFDAPWVQVLIAGLHGIAKLRSLSSAFSVTGRGVTLYAHCHSLAKMRALVFRMWATTHLLNIA